MSVENKQFPATETKLRRLRQAGTVAFSADFTSFGVTIGFFVGVGVFLLRQVDELLPFLKAFWAGGRVNVAGAESVSSAFKVLLEASACFLLAVLTIVVLLGFYQTRFLFTLIPLRPSLASFASLGRNLFGDFSGRVSQVFFATIKVLAWVVVVVLFMLHCISEMPQNLVEIDGAVRTSVAEADYAAKQEFNGVKAESEVTIAFRNYYRSFGRYLLFFFAVILGFSFFVGILSRFVVVVAYANKHKMSRAEIEAENRESEASPEMKTAMKALIQEE
ncbi:MAG: EscU/YscU/HrcU family type III secretion system export apparatus switch protein [Deltaproteobacteria bacterium]|nr:EscU/YscU/HrcU family type III secretion system export apparatus switch protein [Deltaproteobacteria bacterium]